MEEIGYGSNNLHHLTSFSLAPGYLGHFTHVVVAQELSRNEQWGMNQSLWRLCRGA